MCVDGCVQRYVELYTNNDGRTLKVDALSEDKFIVMARSSKRYEVADKEVLHIAATERQKMRMAEKMKIDYGKVQRAPEAANAAPCTRTKQTIPVLLCILALASAVRRPNRCI